ncbi:hypothetical protein M9H77_23677 [Catharanthus roseus]|uniref:Uncharacterized protein n=1 Tax=Catharanthus roseus TaxID=4058 RepID=A0ACC0AUY1_CATRO|nr:hypothetical protein M9H77_23677 [Catharanthus roseus]
MHLRRVWHSPMQRRLCESAKIKVYGPVQMSTKATNKELQLGKRKEDLEGTKGVLFHGLRLVTREGFTSEKRSIGLSRGALQLACANGYERFNAVDSDLDVNKPKETTLQNDERPSAIAIMPNCNGKNTSSVSVAFPLQAASLPAKCRTFSHFKTTFADYAHQCHNLLRKNRCHPNIVKRWVQLTQLSKAQGRLSQPEFAPEQLVPVLECGIERFLEEHKFKVEVDPTRPFQQYGKGTHPLELGRGRFLISQGLNGKDFFVVGWNERGKEDDNPRLGPSLKDDNFPPMLTEW